MDHYADAQLPEAETAVGEAAGEFGFRHGQM